MIWVYIFSPELSENTDASTWDAKLENVPSDISVQRRLKSDCASALSVRMKKLCILGYPKCAKWRFWPDFTNAQADLNLRRAQLSEGTFSDVAAHLDGWQLVPILSREFQNKRLPKLSGAVAWENSPYRLCGHRRLAKGLHILHRSPNIKCMHIAKSTDRQRMHWSDSTRLITDWMITTSSISFRRLLSMGGLIVVQLVYFF